MIFRNKRTIASMLLLMLAVMYLLPQKIQAAEYSCTITVPVSTEIAGENAPTETEFNIYMETLDKANPMPEVTELLLTGTDNGTFGPITYTKPEDYQYRIYQATGNAKHITYDDTVYTVTVRVTNADDGSLNAVIWAIRDGEENKVDKITFVNEYEPPVVAKPKTGDTNDMAMWLVLGGMSLLCITGVLIRKKKDI